MVASAAQEQITSCRPTPPPKDCHGERAICMEAAMVGRVWIGLAMILFGIVGLLVGWQLERNGGDTAVLAVFSALALAAGCLLAASAGGEVAVRVTGGLLFATGFGVAVTNHEAWWW